MSIEKLEARVIALEARVAELEDERAIRELLARYGYNADCMRDEAYIDLYTDDCAIETHGGNRFEGKEGVRTFITKPDSHHAPGFYGKSMHVQGNNAAMHIDGNDAVVNSYSFVFVADGTAFRNYSAGNNQWTLRKVDGQWKIRERRRSRLGEDSYPDNLGATPA